MFEVIEAVCNLHNNGKITEEQLEWRLAVYSFWLGKEDYISHYDLCSAVIDGKPVNSKIFSYNIWSKGWIGTY